MKHMISLSLIVTAASVAAAPTHTWDTPAEIEINDICFAAQKSHVNLKLEDCKQPYLDCLNSDQYKQQNTQHLTDEQVKSLMKGVIQCAKNATPQNKLESRNQNLAKDSSSSNNQDEQDDAIHFPDEVQRQQPQGFQANKDKEQQQGSQENGAKQQKDRQAALIQQGCRGRYADELTVTSGVCSQYLELCAHSEDPNGRKQIKDLMPCAHGLVYDNKRASRLSQEARQRAKDGKSPPEGDYGFVPRPENDEYDLNAPRKPQSSSHGARASNEN